MKIYIILHTVQTKAGSTYQVVEPEGYKDKGQAAEAVKAKGSLIRTPFPDSYEIMTENGTETYLVVAVEVNEKKNEQ